jgi:hypothetical protein
MVTGAGSGMAKPPKAKPKETDRETEILRRMLSTPPKPHKPKKDAKRKQSGTKAARPK